MLKRDPDSAVAWGVALVAATVLAITLIGLASLAMTRLFPTYTRAFRTAERLTAAVQAGPLSAPDRDLLLALCDGDDYEAGHRARMTLPLAVDHNPDWRLTVVEHFARLAADPSDRGRQDGAKLMLAKLTRPPQQP